MTLTPETTLASVLIAGIVGLFWLYTRNLLSQIAELKSENASFENMLKQNLFAAETAVNRNLTLQGKPPFEALAPVVPEHSSPITVKQSRTANLATYRARTVRVRKLLDLPPETIDEADKGTGEAKK